MPAGVGVGALLRLVREARSLEQRPGVIVVSGAGAGELARALLGGVCVDRHEARAARQHLGAEIVGAELWALRRRHVRVGGLHGGRDHHGRAGGIRGRASARY